MSTHNDTTNVYAAAEGREFLAGALEGKTNKWINEFAGLIDDPGTLDLLNYYCSLWGDENENFLETRMAHIIITNAATETMDSAFRAGNVSQIKGAIGLTSNSKDAGDALAEIGRRLADEGCIAFIVGPPGSGKTAFMADITRVWAARTGGLVYSNLDWDGSDGLVLNDREMFESMASVKGPTLGALDELSTELTGRGADSVKAEDFARSLTLIRKREAKHGRHAKRGSVLGVAHTKKRLAASLRRMATLIIQKPSRNDQGKVVLFESEGGADDLEKIGEYQGLTDTRETYGEHEASAFDVIGDESDDEKEETVDVNEIRRREQIQLAINLVEPWNDGGGLSYSNAAAKTMKPEKDPETGQRESYASSWVGDRVREWKAGDHRELVGDPKGGSA